MVVKMTDYMGKPELIQLAKKFEGGIFRLFAGAYPEKLEDPIQKGTRLLTDEHIYFVSFDEQGNVMPNGQPMTVAIDRWLIEGNSVFFRMYDSNLNVVAQSLVEVVTYYDQST